MYGVLYTVPSSQYTVYCVVYSVQWKVYTVLQDPLATNHIHWSDEEKEEKGEGADMNQS